MFDGLDAEGRGDMGFARAWPANQDDVLGTVAELATMQLTNQSLVDLACGKIEAGQILVSREPR